MKKIETLEVNAIGAKVKLEDDIIGTIIGINISHNNSILYQVGWWNGRSYCTETFMQEQIEAIVTTEKTRIGFI